MKDRKIHSESSVWSTAQRQKIHRFYGHVLRRALDFEVEGQGKKGRPKRTWKR